jgi:cell division protein ZapE
MFFRAALVETKQRIHFYSLMLGIHKNVHLARQKNIDDPLKYVATELAKQTQLLCIDEFQVSDVADAMILSKLFTVLLDMQVIIFITSNRPPEELYKGGLQREKFLDFVRLVRARMDILELSSPHDYRTRKIKNLQSVYLSPLSEENAALLKKIFSDLTNNLKPAEVMLEVQGRKLQVQEAVGKIASFTFSELCEKPLGSADYLAICQRFDTIFINGIPILSPEKRNEARRFVTLIDSLYDNHIKLICTAETTPDRLYPKGDGNFEFHRTVSRLIEMQSEQYLST